MAYQYDLLRLLQVPQIGPQRIGRLLAELDFAEFCSYDKAQLRQIGWNEKQIQRWFNPDKNWIEQALTWAEQPNQQILSLFDKAYPFLLRQISTAPPILFVKGNVESLALPQIAIVGSRDYSPYGEYWAGQFAADLVKHNMAVTSGLAIGIDGFAHKKVVEHQGITIAVLGSGLNRIYPARHQKLAEQIVELGGALVSEFSPNQPPITENFPRRNRIISGLSLGTLVIEATINSGSLITARYALEQGREVFALPNAVQNPYAQGCHKLIKEGALLVECVEDMLEAVASQYQPQQIPLFDEPKPIVSTSLQAVKSSEKFAKNPPNLTACQQQIYQHISLEPIAIDDLARATELTIETLLVELLGLELAGVIKQVSGGYVMDNGY
ncbi:DNA-processing protein DprA [Mannheimia haemolytica]|uniref:DNA-processing protein DprA n=1 Tax=Mannheimia haemolytica TaxID=75985 RepID=UPI000386D8CD|nr:DNA-processing protein DprA [Mannheimia haemolytica]EPY98758.1 DNA repair protein Smf [Mannheimia haemolytica D35]MDW0616724.1 DNA-processing protein DprA [Mannheimia haemolytica]MDW1149291.1 DNA-processing protein DprA [Mannheimia haemolytica]MDW1159643.1 DNA-processing protein DprA [Mannheimia haemolytica]NBB67191.1 DNA-protecting protein DprA [Mannheimia haemolytica]